MSYQALSRLDSSDLYFNKALRSNYISKGKIYYSIILGNIGHNFYLKKDYTKAIPLLQQDMNRAIEEGRKGLAVGSATTLANIYLEQGKPEKVKPLIDSIFSFIRASRQWERLKLVYPVVSRYYAAIGDLRQSDQYLDSALSYNDSMSRKFTSLQLARAQQKTERAQIQARQQAFQSAGRQGRKLQFIFLLASILLVTSAILIYIRQSKRNKGRQEQKEQQLQKFKLELSKAEAQIQDFHTRLATQSQQIEQMELQQTGNSADHILNELRQRAILTDENWLAFRTSFDQVHHGFIDRLQEKHPRISPAEIRVLVLARLHFSTKEMGTALGISPGSVRVTWHRLRKKLNISDSVSIEELADLI